MSYFAQTTPAKWASNSGCREVLRFALDASFPGEKPPVSGPGFFFRRRGYIRPRQRQFILSRRQTADHRTFTPAGFSSVFAARRGDPLIFDVVAFVPTFFDAVAATGRAKREAHLCSKRLWT
jgi:hypothetical protein